MKLHLPKMLRVAVMATFAIPVMGATLTSNNIVTPVEGGASYLNVGMENETDTWAGDLTIGDTADSAGDVDNVGAFNDSWGWITPNGGKTNTTITSGLKVTGNVTVQGAGKIVLGGQYKGGSSYTGLEATGGITVTGGTLTSTKITTTDLNVSGGTVSTSTGNCTSGNSVGTLSWYLAKKSYIKNSLTLSGGSLSFGYTDNVQGIGGGGHCMTAFGESSSFTMTQTGGTLRVYGDMDLKSGSTFNQQEGAGIMVLRDTIYMGGSGTTTFNQSGDAAKLVVGRLESTGSALSKPQCDFVFNQSGKGLIHLAYGSNLYKAGTITLNQTGGGSIIIGGEHDTKITGALPSRGYALSGFENNNTTYTIDQTGNGTINVKSDATLTADTVKVGADAELNIAGTVNVADEATLKGTATVNATGSLTGNSVKVEGALYVEAGGLVNVSSFTVNSDSQINNKGCITLGSGTGSTTAGALGVTTGGTLNAILDGTNAVLNIRDNSITSWTMASGSTFGVGFTSAYLDTLSIDDDNKLAFSNVLVATGATGSSVSIDGGISYIIANIGGTDASRWTLDSSTALTTDTTTGNVVLSGALIYNPWIELKNGGTVTEAYGDTNTTKKLYTGLAISEKSVALNADNTHSYGTKIDGGTSGITVTLGAEKALGTGANVEEGRAAVETAGKTTLATADKVVANLPGTIDNTGDLTMQGTYTAEEAALGGKTTVEDAYFNIDGEKVTTADGFLREGGDGYKVVNNIDAATLNPTDATVTVGGTTYYLYESGYAGLNLIDYSTYYMNSADHEAVVSEILDASDKLSNKTVITDKVVMNEGILTVDDSIEVDFTGGEVIMADGGEVTGTIEDTKVQADGGAISADITGSSSVNVTKNTTLAGDNDYTGGTIIDNSTLTLSGENALGNGDVTSKREAGLTTAGSVVANLPATISIANGTLTMSGKYKADADNLNDGLTETQGDAWFDTEGKAGNGFMREGGEAYRVVDVTNGSLNVNALDDVSVKVDGTVYQLYSDGLAGSKLDYSTYYIKGEHEVAVSEIHAANDSDTDTDTTKVVLESKDGALTADSSIDVEATGGSIAVTDGATVSGTIADTDITSTGGTIAATVSGDSSITATGSTTISEANSYSGGTIIDGAELIARQADSLGSGLVTLKNGAILDLSGAAVDNAIRVEGCTLRGGSAYEGDMEVLNNLNLGGATTANKVTLSGNGTLTGGSMTTSTLDVQTSGDANLGTDLTIRDGGLIVLNNGKVLNVSGSLTLAGSTTLKLAGAYQVGDVLVNSDNTLTMGTVELVYADETVEIERVGNSFILVSKFKQPIAEAMSQGNWGIATASRTFVNTVRGQRNNYGCIADGKGTVWFSVMGARNSLSSADVSVEGAAVGTDMKVDKISVLGVAFGYSEGKVTPTGQRRISQDTYYAAVYGEHGLRKLSDTSCLSLDWVAAYGTTESNRGNLNWEQDSLQLNARVNWNKQLNSRVRVSAFGGLEYFASNSGSDNGISSGSLQNLRGELGVAASYVAMGTTPLLDEKTGQTITPGCEKLVLHGEVRFMGDLYRSNPVVEMAGLRGMSTNPGRVGVGIEVGTTYRLNTRWTTSANYGYNAMDGANEHLLNLGASYSF